MKSMTGYGKGISNVNGRNLVVELKSVNHRYLDLSIKMPKVFFAYEDLMRQTIAERVSRGHVDVYLTYTDLQEKQKEVVVDIGLAKGMIAAAERLQAETQLKNDFQLNALMRTPDILKVISPEDDPEELKQLLRGALNAALDQLDEMKQKEGAKLKSDLLAKMKLIEGMVQEVTAIAPRVVENYREKLWNRIREALKDITPEDTRLLTEIALFADKSCIDEELTRLHSHLTQFREIAESEQPIGRKLDFLVQEFNRETNTICSKSNLAELTNIGLKMKNEIEELHLKQKER